jgi:hypothetical protein
MITSNKNQEGEREKITERYSIEKFEQIIEENRIMKE